MNQRLYQGAELAAVTGYVHANMFRAASSTVESCGVGFRFPKGPCIHMSIH